MPRPLARLTVIVGLVAVLAVSAIGIASAAIPDSVTKVYTVCKNSSGALRMIDYQAGKRCTSTEVTRTWNQRGLTGATGQPGPSGAPGADGADGAAGADGAQGPAGVSGYEVVTGEFTMALNVEYGTSTLDCPTGKVPLGGGYDFSEVYTVFSISTPEKDFMGASYPSGTGWTVKWKHGISNLPIDFTMYVVCATAS